ncbi:unnamed protein product [Gadus morhua 'NCC']
MTAQQVKKMVFEEEEVTSDSSQPDLIPLRMKTSLKRRHSQPQCRRGCSPCSRATAAANTHPPKARHRTARAEEAWRPGRSPAPPLSPREPHLHTLQEHAPSRSAPAHSQRDRGRAHYAISRRAHTHAQPESGAAGTPLRHSVAWIRGPEPERSRSLGPSARLLQRSTCGTSRPDPGLSCCAWGRSTSNHIINPLMTSQPPDDITRA